MEPHIIIFRLLAASIALAVGYHSSKCVYLNLKIIDAEAADFTIDCDLCKTSTGSSSVQDRMMRCCFRRDQIPDNEIGMKSLPDYR